MRISKIVTYSFILWFCLTIVSHAAAQNNREIFELYNFDMAYNLAIENNKHLFLFFEAEWCGICKQMRREVFPDSDIQELMAEYFYPVAIDLESESTLHYKGEKRTERSFSHLMRINATPTIIFINGAGEPVGINQGFMDKSELKNLLIYVGEGFIEDMEFDEFINSDSSDKSKEKK